MTPGQVLLAYEDALEYLVLINGGPDDTDQPTGSNRGAFGPEPSIENLATIQGVHIGDTIHKDELPAHLRDYVNDALKGGMI